MLSSIIQKINCKLHKCLTPCSVSLAINRQLSFHQRIVSFIIITNLHTVAPVFTVTGYGKFNMFTTFVCGLCVCCSLLSVNDISYLLPITECEFDLSPFQKGLLSSSYFAGIFYQ